MQIAWYTRDAHPKLRWLRDSELLTLSCQRLNQVGVIPSGGAKILDPVASFTEQFIRALERLLHQVARRLAVGNAVGCRLEPPDQSLHALQQRVVKLACDAFALAEPGREQAACLQADLRDSQTVQTGEYSEAQEGAQRMEPFGLIESRHDYKVKRRARGVPYPVAVGCNHTESIVAGTEIGIDRVMTASNILPVGIGSLELVTKSHALGDSVAAGAVVDLHIRGV